MLKITPIEMSSDGTWVLQLEGQVAGPWVAALRRACTENLKNSDYSRLVLDLGGVSFIDAAGVALFRELAALRVAVTNGSIYVAEQLKEAGNGNA